MTELQHSTETPLVVERGRSSLVGWLIGALVVAVVAAVGLGALVYADHQQTPAQRDAVVAVQTYVDAMNAHDATAVAAASTSDCTWISIGGGVVVDGPYTGDALTAAVKDWVDAGIDLETIGTPAVSGDTQVVVQTHATFSSEPTAGGSGAITYTVRDDGDGLKVASAVFVLTSGNDA